MNVLIITADDMGRNMGAYGDKHADTPRLDALAADGVLMECGYVTAPSCSSSRSSILKGTYPHQNDQIGLAHYGYTSKTGVNTIPGMLKRQGYFNGVIGKIHVAPENSFPFEYKKTNARETTDVGLVLTRFREALDQAGERPFFMYVNYFDPHKPFFQQFKGRPARPMLPKDAPKLAQIPPMELTDKVREEIAGYYNGIARVDIGVGMLVDELKKRGHYENTLIVFLGDHGAPFPRGKNSVFETGVGVPFLLRWPGVQQPHVEQRFVSTIDILPTVLDATGIEIPKHHIGRSMRPLAANDQQAPWRKYVCAENNSHGTKCWYPQRSLREGNFKLIHTINSAQPHPNPRSDGGDTWLALMDSAPEGSQAAEIYRRHRNPPEWQLYDLSRDGAEFIDLAANPEYAAVLKRLQDSLREWRQNTSDPTLDPKLLEFLNEAHEKSGKHWDNEAWVKERETIKSER